MGGVDISQIREEELMAHMTKITHNSYLFAGTVEENLRMAKPDATREELEHVLEKVNLLAFLKEQDELQTVLLEKGKISLVDKDSVWHLQERCCLIRRSTYLTKRHPTLIWKVKK